MPEIKVTLVEDNDKIRNGLFMLINGSEGLKCISEYSNGEAAVKSIPFDNPDVVLMDINLPGISGIECVKKLKEKMPELQIMMITIYEEEEQVFQSLLAGASGYILKRTPPAELLEAIKELHEGGSPMSVQIARKVVDAFRKIGKSSRETENLSDREIDILSSVAKGFQDQEIAEQLNISVKTVRTHLRNIYKKLHVRSRTEAALKYLHK